MTRRSCLPGLRRGGGGRQAGATILSCLVWRCELTLTRIAASASYSHARLDVPYVVCVCVGHDRGPCKHGRSDRDVVWRQTRARTKNHSY